MSKKAQCMERTNPELAIAVLTYPTYSIRAIHRAFRNAHCPTITIELFYGRNEVAQRSKSFRWSNWNDEVQGGIYLDKLCNGIGQTCNFFRCQNAITSQNFRHFFEEWTPMRIPVPLALFEDGNLYQENRREIRCDISRAPLQGRYTIRGNVWLGKVSDL